MNKNRVLTGLSFAVGLFLLGSSSWGQSPGYYSYSPIGYTPNYKWAGVSVAMNAQLVQDLGIQPPSNINDSNRVSSLSNIVSVQYRGQDNSQSGNGYASFQINYGWNGTKYAASPNGVNILAAIEGNSTQYPEYGYYRITWSASQYAPSLYIDIQYAPYPTKLAVRFINAQTGQPITGAIYGVQINSAVGSYCPLQSVSGGGGYTNLPVTPANRTLGYVCSATGMQTGTVYMSGTYKEYNEQAFQYTVYMQPSGNGAPSAISSDPTPTPGPTPTPAASYDGPPNDKSWFTDMLSQAFVPSNTTLTAWQTTANHWKTWGPFGFVASWLSIFQFNELDIQTEGGSDVYNNPTGVFGIDCSLIPGQTTPLEFDFRSRNDNWRASGRYQTKGTVYGDVRAVVRWWLGLGVYLSAGLMLYRWLRPRLSI